MRAGWGAFFDTWGNIFRTRACADSEFIQKMKQSKDVRLFLDWHDLKQSFHVEVKNT